MSRCISVHRKSIYTLCWCLLCVHVVVYSVRYSSVHIMSIVMEVRFCIFKSDYELQLFVSKDWEHIIYTSPYLAYYCHDEINWGKLELRCIFMSLYYVRLLAYVVYLPSRIQLYVSFLRRLWRYFIMLCRWFVYSWRQNMN